MLKREIKYTDFDDVVQTEVFYFNISKPEWLEMEVEQKEGFSVWIQNVIKADDNKTLIEQFKKIILAAYGEKSPDGKRFVKSDELRENFSHTAAFQELFMELATDADSAAEFVKGILPKDMAGQVEQAIAEVETPQQPVPSAPPT